MPRKNERGTLWSRPVLYDTRETFLVQFFAWPTGAGNLNFCVTFGITIQVTSGVSEKISVKNTDEKP